MQYIEIPAAAHISAAPGPGEQWRITAAQARQSFQVQIVWQALHPNDRDYTVFLHLWDAQGRKVGQQDQQPTNGQYPIGIQGNNEWITNTVSLPLRQPLLAGLYPLTGGMYLLETMDRLTSIDAQGQRFKNDTLKLGKLEVIP
ncbi:MAG: hypothetical protein EXR62_06495 [Chloroflexi bacterium]|nr:hypothetical protein [Chloroflexota bacterium]